MTAPEKRTLPERAADAARPIEYGAAVRAGLGLRELHTIREGYMVTVGCTMRGA